MCATCKSPPERTRCYMTAPKWANRQLNKQITSSRKIFPWRPTCLGTFLCLRKLFIILLTKDMNNVSEEPNIFFQHILGYWRKRNFKIIIIKIIIRRIRHDQIQFCIHIWVNNWRLICFKYLQAPRKLISMQNVSKLWSPISEARVVSVIVK